MKPTRICLILLAWCLAPASCTTQVTRTITTDKAGTVTDVTTTAKGMDPGALRLAEVVASVYVPRRPVLVREEKSDAEIRRLLRGWQGRSAVALDGPITAAEIQNRFRP